MKKTILFAGKELPDGNDLVSGASFQGRKVIATISSPDEGEQPKNGSDSTRVFWNRGSSLSARALVLKCENEGGIDEAVLVFDESSFAVRFGDSSENSRILEELIGSYQYLTQELIARHTRNESKPAKIVFLHKTNYSLSDGIVSNSVRISGVALSPPLVASASGAFRSFAESTAASLAEKSTIIPLLVSCEPSNDLSKRDSPLSMWLCGYLDSIDSLKKPLSPKQKVSWIKAGAKNPGGFGLF